ncbi:MAG TPA: PPC domain-containing DNA-binding protein, partial [Pyrinomonadaceae bacterium]
MKSKLLSERAGRTFILVFDKGDEAISALTDFARENNVLSGHFNAIGAFSRLTFGFFERERKDYKRIEIDEPVEVMSLAGNIA